LCRNRCGFVDKLKSFSLNDFHVTDRQEYHPIFHDAASTDAKKVDLRIVNPDACLCEGIEDALGEVVNVAPAPIRRAQDHHHGKALCPGRDRADQFLDRFPVLSSRFGDYHVVSKLAVVGVETRRPGYLYHVLASLS
jgi:hypothetical protein